MQTKYIIIGVIILVIGIVGMFALRWATIPFFGALEQREQIQGSGDFRIHSYQHFFNLCRTIQEAESQYDNQYDLLKELKPSDENYSRQQRNVSVLKARIERLKQRYNGDAAQEETLSAFKNSDLPEKIEIGVHEYGHRTKCNF